MTDGLKTLKRVGGHLALDFNNTADRRAGTVILEWINSYKDLLFWARECGILEMQHHTRLSEIALEYPVLAWETLQDAYHLRAVIYETGAALAAGQRPILDALLPFLRENATQRQLLWQDERIVWGWEWTFTPRDLRYPLWVIAQAYADLLTVDADKLRECAGEDCGWLFLDTSRNRSRRWCDMGDCGNRAKAKRHYRRLTQG